MVYIREAHPSDGWQVPQNVREDIVYASPKTYDERCRLASLCEAGLGIEFPAVVDNMDDKTEEAYTAWPDRLYVVDRDGRIAYKSGPGPRGFKAAGVAQALARLLDR